MRGKGLTAQSPQVRSIPKETQRGTTSAYSYLFRNFTFVFVVHIVDWMPTLLRLAGANPALPAQSNPALPAQSNRRQASVLIEKENIFGTQFHPEKSDKTGLKIIDNFINL